MAKKLNVRSYNLNIAGYNIRFEAADGGFELIPSSRFQRFISGKSDPDILINVLSVPFTLPPDALMVFHAPLIEEKDGGKIKKSDDFWSIYSHHNDIYIKTILPHSVDPKAALLKFSLTSRNWELYIDGASGETDPFDYPLDGLVLYYLTVINGDIMIHASGADHSGHGYVFSGVSGKGKTTLSKLWDNAGAKIIHDDRLILRNIDGNYKMFNTPVYDNEEPSESTLTRIYLIEHGTENSSFPLNGATAVSQVMTNCIQHNWDPEIIARLMDSLSNMCTDVPVEKLSFKPDSSIVDFILYHE